MADLYKTYAEAKTAKPHRFSDMANEEIKDQLTKSSTLYVGNLSFYTTEEQIYALFSRCGEVKRIIMGLDRIEKTPCGFCFVEFYTKEDAGDCHNWINGTKLDDRTIRTDWDPGFAESRQYGRGQFGGQVRDEFRTDYDPGRGGYGKGREKQRELLEPFVHSTTAYEAPAEPYGMKTGDRSITDRFGRTRTDRAGDRNDRGEKETGSKNPRFREENSDSDEEEGD